MAPGAGPGWWWSVTVRMRVRAALAAGWCVLALVAGRRCSELEGRPGKALPKGSRAAFPAGRTATDFTWTGLDCVGFSTDCDGFHRISPDCAGFYWTAPDFTGLPALRRTSPDCARISRGMYTGFRE